MFMKREDIYRYLSLQFTEDHVSVYTEYSEKDQRISSSIHLPSVTWEDSGQYTCMQPSAKPASIKLLVIEGK